MSDKSAVDYAAVLADLEAQRAKLDVAIEAIRALQGAGNMTITPQTGAVNMNGGAPEIAIDAFHKLTVSQAIRKYLAMRRKPATTPEIVEALAAGGQAGSDGNNFLVVVNNTLNRMQAPDGGISKVKRGVWGLAEWYDDKPKKPTQEG
jgi:hypothetical protein